MLSTSERKWSQRSHVKDYFVSMQFPNTIPSVQGKKSVWCYFLCQWLHYSFTDGAAKWNTPGFVILSYVRTGMGKEWLEWLSVTSMRKNSIGCIGKRHYMQRKSWLDCTNINFSIKISISHMCNVSSQNIWRLSKLSYYFCKLVTLSEQNRRVKSQGNTFRFFCSFHIIICLM